MSNTKLSQYTHRPNMTELGLGNTHETYMLISTDTDLSHMFPPSIEVMVRDVISGKRYALRSTNGREFRVNQMAEIYRDYNVLPGDEIVITKIEKDNASDICVNVRQYSRIVIMAGSNGAEIVNIDRLINYQYEDGSYKVSISDRGNTNLLSLKFKESRKKRQDSPKETDYYDVTINGENLANGTYYLTLGEPLSSLSMLPKSEYNEVSFDENVFGNLITNKEPETTKDILPTYRQYITAIKSKPFLLLAGISGTGKSRIVREFAFKSCPKFLQDKEGTTPGNYCMIEVKPNWHDSTELLGYYSNLSKNYQFKKFVKFLVKAKMFPDVPFFVCLDEMNLAPVEQYFAEILSILETRKHPKNKETGEVDLSTIKTEVIVDAQYFKQLSTISSAKNQETGAGYNQNLTDRDIYMKLFDIETECDIAEEIKNRTDLTKVGLTLPDNVIIIGTVNMDDTTHQFSRKVIDRAMTIEMNGGRLVDMYGGSKDLEYLDEDEQQKWQYNFSQRYVTADEVLVAHPKFAEEIKKKLPIRLEEINHALKGTPFEVSYRVLNELTIMVGVMLDDNEKNESLDSIINQAINNILLMKILPRIEGDAEMFALSKEYKVRMGISYDDRLEWLKDLAPDLAPETETASDENTSENETEGDNEDASDNESKGSTIHQQTAKEKIQEMIDRLNNQDFTRFWP